MSGKAYVRIGLIVLVLGLLAWFLFGAGRPRECEEIVPDTVYRATVTSVSDFTAAEAKLHPATVGMLIPAGQDKVEPWYTVTQYAFRNQIRVDVMPVPADGTLTFARIADLVKEFRGLTHTPVLLIGPSGVDSGKLAAAYRLAIEKKPLAEVERLAELPDAPPETTRALREFARSYDQALRELAAKQAATAPATAATK